MNEQTARDFLDEYVRITEENKTLHRANEYLEKEIKRIRDNALRRFENDATAPFYEVMRHPLMNKDDAQYLLDVINAQFHSIVHGDDE